MPKIAFETNAYDTYIIDMYFRNNLLDGAVPLVFCAVVRSFGFDRPTDIRQVRWRRLM